MSQRRPSPRVLPVAVRAFAGLLPHSERDEVAADLAAEHAARRVTDGGLRAGAWLWWQVLASAPALVRRSWWRGRTGFEPASSQFRSGGPMWETWIVDARYAVRRLTRRRQYTLLAVLTLALGVGGTAAIGAIVRELLLSPLPVSAEADVAVWWAPRGWSESEFLFLRDEQVPGFSALAGYGPEDVRVSGAGGMRVVPALRTSADLFDVLGVGPEIGPGFLPGDDAAGSELRVVLSHAFWRDMGADPRVIGSTLELNGVARTVVGVMPRGFWFPDADTRLWLAHPFSADNNAGWYTLLGRLSPGHTPGSTAGALSAISTALGEVYDYPAAWDKTQNASLTPVRDHVLGRVRPTLVATLAAMAVILLLACANVAALMLGQTEARTAELSVRKALGAGRGRLTQQLLVEGAVLGALAGLAGAAFATLAFGLLVAALPLGALAERASLDWSIFWFAMAVAVGAALLIALVPVTSMLRAELRGTLTQARTGGIAGRGGRLESGLVVAEVALAVMIAAGAALLMRSVANLRALDTGIDVSGVAVLDVVAPAELTNAGRTQVMRELVEGLAAVPGVTHAAAAQRLPLRGGGDNWGLTIEGRPDVTGVTTAFRVITSDYLPAVRARLVSGRFFESGDRADAERVAVINEALARQFFPGEDPVGRHLLEFGEPARIIGVVGNIREAGLTDASPPARYVLYEQVPYAPASNSLVLRLAPGVDPGATIDAARRVVQSVAPSVGIQDATTMERVLDRALGPTRQLMSLLALLTGLALLLGGIGVYGVVSHFVHRRRRDWGIRMALGLRPFEVLRLVVGKGALLVTGGIGIGVAGALLLGRLLEAFVFGVGTTDPVALGAAAGVLFTVGVAGALVPARRASRVDPARVLREQ